MQKHFKNKDAREQFFKLCKALKREPGELDGQWNLIVWNQHYRIESLQGDIIVYPYGEGWRKLNEFIMCVNFSLFTLYIYTNGAIAVEE